MRGFNRLFEVWCNNDSLLNVYHFFVRLVFIILFIH